MAVNQMDQMTQQNAAMVEEAAASTAKLAEETAHLRALVARFKVTGGGVQTATRTVGAPRAHQPAPRPATRGATALATAAHADEDSWEEF